MLPAIRSAIPSFPRELLPIIADYAIEIPHAWRPDTKSANFSVTIAGNRAESIYYYFWYRVLANETIKIGPRRWRIRGLTCNVENVAVGLTTHYVGGSSYIKSPDDLLIALRGANGMHAVVTYNGRCKRSSFGAGSLVDDVKIEIDVDRRILLATFDNDRLRRELAVGIPKAFDLDRCRPCAVLRNLSAVSILDWSDDSSVPVPRLTKQNFVKFD